MKRFLLFQSLIAFIILLILGYSCRNFYKVGENSTEAFKRKEVIDSLNKSARYFILRTGDNAYYMRDIVLSSDQKYLTCTLDTLAREHRLHLKNGHRGNKQYKKNKIEENQVLNEVHLYIDNDNDALPQKSYLLALDKVHKIEVLTKDVQRTTISYIVGAVGYTIGAMTIAGIIIMATKSSCPFVSAYDGQQFALQGEIYGGAIYPQLARSDYIPLKLAPLPDHTLQIKISNELKEKQFTDFTRLLVITHRKETKVLADEAGNLYNIAHPQAPVSAELNGIKNVLPALAESEDNRILYMDDSSRDDAKNEVVLQFENTRKSKKGKLLLKLKNSYWLDLLYGELSKGFGWYYNTYLEQQKNKTAAELNKWVLDQQIPLLVAIKTTSGWKKTTALTTIGPLAFREMVVPIDLSDAPIIEIKLSSGFMFWEIDKVALDTSPNDVFRVEKLQPLTAVDEKGTIVTSQLEKEDGVFLKQPNIGNVTTISFRAPALMDNEQSHTYILEAKGYYQHVRQYTNMPNFGFLKQFKQSNAFPIYGKKLYQIYQEASPKLIAKAN